MKARKQKQKETFKVSYDPVNNTIERDDDPEGLSFGEAKRELVKYYQQRIRKLRDDIKEVRALAKEDCR